MADKQKFSWKIFISFSLFLSFFVIFFSGIILYLAPAGRVSNWVNWTILGFTKTQWQSLHTLFSYTFAILSVFHLFSYNWRAFVSYMKAKTKTGINKTRELVWSVLFFVFIFAGTYFEVPPFSTVVDFGEYLTESWENKDEAAPIAHAEELNLNELAEQLENTTLQQLENRLKNNEIKYDNAEQTLKIIAAANGKTPLEIYKIVSQSAAQSEGKSGRGIGRIPLKDLAIQDSLNIDSVILKLKAAGYEASPEKTLKEIADEYDLKPFELYELIK